MNLENIALVRATNVIPFDGIVRPVSEVPYLKKNTNTQFGFNISDLLRKHGKIPPVPFRLSDEYIKKSQEIIKEYVPYVSDYNSMVLWAINGLVPDDSEHGFGNNTFSNKKCVIIDGLKEQLELSNVVSLVPTDTAIRGNVKLSSSAIILIEQDEYDRMSEDEKKKLSNLNLTVKTFEGDLRENVEQALLETGRYIPERPVLSRSNGGYKKSDTSDELIQTINNVASENKILQLYHMGILLSRDRKSLGELEDEFDNINIINKYFQKRFFKFLFEKMDIKKDLSNDLLEYPENDFYIKQLCKEIEDLGIDRYKELVDEYNHELEQLKAKVKLLTPQQVVDLERQKNVKEEDNVVSHKEHKGEER